MKKIKKLLWKIAGIKTYMVAWTGIIGTYFLWEYKANSQMILLYAIILYCLSEVTKKAASNRRDNGVRRFL